MDPVASTESTSVYAGTTTSITRTLTYDLAAFAGLNLMLF
jgi:hypothetical protein